MFWQVAREGSALVGTFLGILLCYGFVGPIAAKMAKSTDEEHSYYHVLRVVIVSFIVEPFPVIFAPAFRKWRSTLRGAESPPPRLPRHLLLLPLPEACDAVSSTHHHQEKIMHGGHHGGAWKVAYADFVSAMMALFIVLWLMNSSVQVKKAIAGYFKDPAGTSKMMGSNMAGVGEELIVTKDNMHDLKDQLEKAIREVPEFDKLENHIDMTVTNEGFVSS